MTFQERLAQVNESTLREVITYTATSGCDCDGEGVCLVCQAIDMLCQLYPDFLSKQLTAIRRCVSELGEQKAELERDIASTNRDMDKLIARAHRVNSAVETQ